MERVDCLMDPTWKFCDSFKDLCVVKAPGPLYKSDKQLGADICASDPNLFCEAGSTDKPKSARVVCENLDKLDAKVTGESAVRDFC